ncbi:MAG: endonuclease/exonuclease/phosphatase family protein [Flavobacteriales bacterium]|nr:endonuclease/exonuclease/phosphatase family protein [Flavobacteriales bacterium]
MSSKSCIVFGLSLCLSLMAMAQRSDTLIMMQYNLLNYRNTTDQCNGQNNDPDVKDAALKTIIAYAKPDILAVNEMGANWLNPSKLLNNALNKAGVATYDQAEYSNNGFSEITNMLFFNSEKLAYHSQTTVSKALDGQSLVRVIDIYKIYLKDKSALDKGDTVFFNIAVVHLKAGSSTSDKNEREQMAEALMDQLSSKQGTDNYFLCGDFNIQSSSEACYQTFTQEKSESIRFYDPADAPGTWSGKSIYSNLHTQSTRSTNTSGGCFSGGGLDDRFDFILIGKEIRDYSNRVGYIDGTYRVLGQDSRRFNGNIINPVNNDVPANVAQALYDASDHLPVLLDLKVGPVYANIPDPTLPQQTVRHHFESGELRIWDIRNLEFDLDVYDVRGKLLFSESGRTRYSFVGSGIAPGVYIVQTRAANGTSIFRMAIP